MKDNNYEFTKEEINAIASLKRAFAKCKKLGLSFSGMDGSLYVCNKRTFELAKKNRSDHKADYSEVAFAINRCYSGADILICGSPYVDSGGW